MGRNRAVSNTSTRSSEPPLQPRWYCWDPAVPARRVLSSQTIGVEFSSKIVHIADRRRSPSSSASRKRMKLQLWDTAGTERFRSVSRSYYRGAAGAILVYDVSSWRSFEQLQTFLNDARALAGPDITIILAGNKNDVEGDGMPPVGMSSSQGTSGGYTSYGSTPSSESGLPPPTPSSQSSRTSTSLNANLHASYTIAPEGREVPTETASRWAGQNGIPVAVEVSALNGENVEELFNRLARMILTKIELGEIDPDDPASGIQYGDLGWDDGGGSIKSGFGDEGVRYRRRGKKPGPLSEWEEVFRLGGTFPAHTGPYKVGSIDVEILTSDLENPSANAPPADLPTVAFRVFYPCKQESNEKAVKWIPSPQREYVSAYARFLGANSAFAGVFSLLPQLLYYISMPVRQNADLLAPPPKSERWPVMMFSHGLGGTRNAYSHICGSLASHGVVVVAADHRDGSSPLAIHHTPEEKEKSKHVGYRPIAHKPSTETYEARDEQLRIRLWELGLIHDALLKIDQGRQMKNVAQDQPKGKSLLAMFSNLLSVHEPGAISFAGHSFGACTMIQFVKSVYHRPQGQMPGYRPLYTPSEDSSIARQITPSNSVTLLDLWTLPIQSPDTAWLRSQPMPCYDSPAGGRNLLAIASEGFYNWASNFRETKRILAKPSASQSKYANQSGPHLFYPIASAHLSQSDFGVLFPWVTTKVFGAKEPERVLKLNTRAILQVLRENGVCVANTSAEDLELEGQKGKDAALAQDTAILSRTKDSVRGWVNLSADMEAGLDLSDLDRIEGKSLVGTPMEKVGSEGKGPGDAVVEGEALGQVVEGNER
ncbi:platelet-activating factor acetylhydrolase [Stemphylium lycopersici]|uniref:1-alkyl-2-acetylglycerophosphocholine esterase n=1 Tax=Stemphylium lycopersici TaxID=183478 RepID=A0A364N588_STELY|nr:platelet-activating factor acetylhydrolase [Stemphylium lycopersici]